MTIEWFPFDSQTCNITYWTWLDTDNNVILANATVDFDSYKPNSVWTLNTTGIG